MTTQKLQHIFDYVEERCLWQFGSRSWDRQESIGGITAAAAALLNGETPKLETGMERLFLAEAKTMVFDLRERCPWLAGESADEIRALMEGLRDRLLDVTITRSQIAN